MEYAKDFNEVKTVGALEQHRAATGPDGRRALLRSVTADVDVFSQVITQAGNEEGWSLSQNARAFAC